MASSSWTQAARRALRELQRRTADLEAKMISDLRDEMRRGFEQMTARFDAFEKRFDAVDKRFDAVNQRFDGVDQRFDGSTSGSIESKAASNDSTTGPIATSCGSSAFSSR
jgi:hypothetical protein